MPILSIIVPVYNVEKYLDNCIQSILHQTYQDWELILVDDGSTDNSGKICDMYAEQDSRITTIHQDDLGQAAARNRALDIAKGKFVTFVDSDDEITGNTYTENLAILDSTPSIEMLCYPIIYKYNTPERKKESFPDQLITNQHDIFLSWYNHRPIDKSSCTKIIRRDVIGDIRYPEGHLHEDFFFMMKLVLHLSSVYISSKGEYHYFSRENSTLHTRSLQKDKDWVDAELEMLRQMYQYPELKREYLPRYMSAARYLMNSTINFPDADINDQLQHLQICRPPLGSFFTRGQRKKDIFWFLVIIIFGIKIFYMSYKKLLTS